MREKEKKQQPPGSEHQMKNYPDHGEYTYKGHALFTGKTVLITGGDSGIGKAIAIAFAREGANIVFVYLSEQEREDAADTLYWIEQAGVKGLAIEMDLKEAENCKKVVHQTISAFGQIDVLINNAAFQKEHKEFKDITLEDWKTTYETNVNALFYMTKYSLEHIPKGGSIIHTTSVNVYDPNPSLLAYASTKAAIQNMTASMSKMFLEQGKEIRVNAVAPGPVWTPLIPTTLSNVDTFGQNTPIERPAQPKEIAPAYIFLASEDATYVSGAIIAVTGGRITL
ncbi:NAD(P)-dependent dehydrogenase (short-subunit alcohol dehydrogenase family) [Myroides gitamensis]|uniref:SDR family oxidoreductase n=1 Tax=Myroides odoratus TaxID=256 RepID=UPI002168434C|nr:SDR family oxidoreductase [Myroides odoratus]MCS4239783.1 NAD(P)-dependent dehydrogenase (short-subunit alcohol dehydrogenase family) [Myroides odoratus]MDH6600685.1 NAD(P)-dependent dehydrogenase (short-subunit alcohol dehydrogenase family) [Myroides gitamensis]